MFCLTLLRHDNVFADEVKPIHEYNFDGDSETTVVDSGINEAAIDAIAYGTNSTTLISGFGENGKARQFNGIDDYISIKKDVIPLGAKSIRFKIRKDASTITSDRSQTIMDSFNLNGKGTMISIGSSIDNKVNPGSLGVFNSFGGFVIRTPDSICDGQWHDVLFTWDGTKSKNSVKLYLDDMEKPVAETTATGLETTGTGIFNIGKCYNDAPQNYLHYPFSGNLDNIQIYNTFITPIPSTLSNLKAVGRDSKVDLTWDAVTNATSYTIKRATTAGGPYTTIASDITETSYTDTEVTNGITYYYVVSSVNAGVEITNSNEASVTPIAGQIPPITEAKLKVVLEVAEALRLSVDDDLSVNTQMAWSSSDESVATVNEKGIVTALAPGNTIITVKSSDGSYTDYINVLVVENADDYRLAIDLKVGETSRLTVDDFTNTFNVKWAPMDSSIANVTSKGKVTALSKGLVLITAKDSEGNIIGRVYVRVRE